MNQNKIPSVFGALAQENRLKVFRILVEHSKDGITPTEIAALMGMEGAGLYIAGDIYRLFIGGFYDYWLWFKRFIKDIKNEENCCFGFGLLQV